MTRERILSEVLVGGKNPDEVYNIAAERTRKAQEEQRETEKRKRDGHNQQGKPHGQGDTDGVAYGTSNPPTDIRGCSPDFGIIDGGDFFNIQGIRYQGKLYAVDLSRQALDPGITYEHDALIKRSMDEIHRKTPFDGFYATSAPFLFHLLGLVMDCPPQSPYHVMSRNVKCEFISPFRRGPLNTLTTVYFDRACSHDGLTHYFGTPFSQESGPYTLHGFYMKDCPTNDVSDDYLSNALTGMPIARLENLLSRLFLQPMQAMFEIPRERPFDPTRFPLSLSYNPNLFDGGEFKISIDPFACGTAFAMRVRDENGNEVLP